MLGVRSFSSCFCLECHSDWCQIFMSGLDSYLFRSVYKDNCFYFDRFAYVQALAILLIFCQLFIFKHTMRCCLYPQNVSFLLMQRIKCLFECLCLHCFSMLLLIYAFWLIYGALFFMCKSSEKLLLSALHGVVPTWYSFHSWVNWCNEDKVSGSRKQHVDSAKLEPSTSVSRNQHSNHLTNMLQIYSFILSNNLFHCLIFSLVYQCSCVIDRVCWIQLFDCIMYGAF